MNNNDLNEMMKKAQYMIQNNQIPDDIKNLINNMQSANQNVSNNQLNHSSNFNNSYNNTASTYTQNTNVRNTNSANNYNSQNNKQNYNQNNVQSNDQNSNAVPNIDVETLMKIQNIMSKMKNSENDDMSKLLLSLKPYLRDGRKDKVDEYIQLIKMGKMTELFNSFGGDKKWI